MNEASWQDVTKYHSQISFPNNHVLFDWSNAGEQGDLWRRAEILLVSAVNYQVVIEGLSGPGYQGDIALDDISFTPSCRPDTSATISPIAPSGTPPPGCNSGQYRYVYYQVSLKCKYLLLTEFEVRTVSYGPSFFPFDLWPKREARGS